MQAQLPRFLEKQLEEESGGLESAQHDGNPPDGSPVKKGRKTSSKMTSGSTSVKARGSPLKTSRKSSTKARPSAPSTPSGSSKRATSGRNPLLTPNPIDMDPMNYESSGEELPSPRMLIADFSRAIADGTPSRKHKGAIRPLQEATDSQSPSKKGKGKDKVGRMADDKEKADEESRKKRRVEETILVLDSDEEQYWQQVDSQIFEAYPEPTKALAPSQEKKQMAAAAITARESSGTVSKTTMSAKEILMPIDTVGVSSVVEAVLVEDVSTSSDSTAGDLTCIKYPPKGELDLRVVVWSEFKAMIVVERNIPATFRFMDLKATSEMLQIKPTTMLKVWSETQSDWVWGLGDLAQFKAVLEGVETSDQRCQGIG
ncbi:hypothetical protein EW026_g3866 [Hermanssonia centrifuga]|uniref:Uncharacterized protein n=1 Tax=Hermanssonia centrifuga TaxID=98765 RepID=A0A4S4KIX4_9APHY|nr:hypothetical protein EW026_g3866 [Hermanssonia centrifuga]